MEGNKVNLFHLFNALVFDSLLESMFGMNYVSCVAESLGGKAFASLIVSMLFFIIFLY